MSRNASGTYTLPAGNPVSGGTVIQSSWANNTLNDIATAMTDSLSRSAQGAMLAALRFVDGTVGAPGLAFNTSQNTGIYWQAASGGGGSDIPAGMGLSAAGAEILRVTTSGVFAITYAALGNNTLSPSAGIIMRAVANTSPATGDIVANVGPAPSGGSSCLSLYSSAGNYVSAAGARLTLRSIVANVHRINSDVVNAGTLLPMELAMNGTPLVALRVVGSSGDVELGAQSLAVGATVGFPYIASCAGAPSGAPTDRTGQGQVPMIYDRTNNRLYIRNGGTWRSVVLT